jgi:hypothetical protein
MYGPPSWSWSYGSWIYNYLCNQCQSPLELCFRTPLWRGVVDTTLCDKVCQWLATGRWFSPGTLVFSNNKTDRNDITEILLKVALNTITVRLVVLKCNRSFFSVRNCRLFELSVINYDKAKATTYPSSRQRAWSVLVKQINCLPFQSTWVHPRVLVGFMLLDL